MDRSYVFIIMSEGDTVGCLDAESEVPAHRSMVLDCIFATGQFDRMVAKQRPEPLIDFHGLIPLCVFLKKIDPLGGRIDQTLPGGVLPAARSYSELGHIFICIKSVITSIGRYLIKQTIILN